MRKVKKILFCIVFLCMASMSLAASFQCDKARSFVEKSICANATLSSLDDMLMQRYKAALDVAESKDTVKDQQRNWISKERDICTDPKCIEHAYRTRLAALDSLASTKEAVLQSGVNVVVLDRCRMNTCDWWKIEKSEVVQAGEKGRLIKLSITSTELEYTDAEVRKHGYPKKPPQNCTWEDPSEAYVFCSDTLPTYIEFSKEKNKYVGTIPFTDQQGGTAGSTEGIGNLYFHICSSGKKARFAISPSLFGADIILDKPTDILNR